MICRSIGSTLVILRVVVILGIGILSMVVGTLVRSWHCLGIGSSWATTWLRIVTLIIIFERDRLRIQQQLDNIISLFLLSHLQIFICLEHFIAAILIIIIHKNSEVRTSIYWFLNLLKLFWAIMIFVIHFWIFIHIAIAVVVSYILLVVGSVGVVWWALVKTVFLVTVHLIFLGFLIWIGLFRISLIRLSQFVISMCIWAVFAIFALSVLYPEPA